MTKPELLETSLILQESLGQVKSQFDSEKKKTADFQVEVSKLRKENATLKRKQKERSVENATDSETKEDRLADLLEKHRALEKQYGSLLSDHNKLQNRLAEHQEQFDNLKSEFDRLLEVKKSLSDSNKHGYILVDHRYIIRFVSLGATIKLNSDALFQYIDQKVFKLFDFDNGMRVKKTIDKVLVGKSSTRLKDAVCNACDGKPVSFKSELYATRFKEKPAVLFTIK